jgi:hypothetical protein
MRLLLRAIIAIALIVVLLRVVRHSLFGVPPAIGGAPGEVRMEGELRARGDEPLEGGF